MKNSFPETNLPTENNLLSLINFVKDPNSLSGGIYETKSIIDLLDGEKQMYVLIADDDEDDQEVLSDALLEISDNIQITRVDNGKTLMEKLAEEKLFDLVFLDLNMPAMNGFECLEKIKANPKLRKLPILIYSTSANPDQIDRTFLQGALYYIQKPSNFNEIKQIMKKLMGFSIDQFYIQPARKDFFLTV
jgi:CheY-like chemotaxis protein